MSDAAPEGDKEMSLRYPGTCVRCGESIPRATRAIYNSAAKNVRHIDCAETLELGVAGASARRENERRRSAQLARHDENIARSKANIQAVLGEGFLGKVATFLAVDDRAPRETQSIRAWATGAEGEERVAAVLDPLDEVGVITLHDRRIPRTCANIDHIAVTPWGVWVIDAKRFVDKKVDFRVVDSFLGIGGRKQLLVGGRERTDLVDKLEGQVAKVADAVGDGVEVQGCLAFVQAEWPLIGGDFFIRKSYVCWPKKLPRVLLRKDEPTIDPNSVARKLAAAFPPA